VHCIRTREAGVALRGARVTVRHYLDGRMDVVFKDRVLPYTTVRKLPQAAAVEDDKTIDARVDAIMARQCLQPLGREHAAREGVERSWLPVCRRAVRLSRTSPFGVALRAILDSRPSRRPSLRHEDQAAIRPPPAASPPLASPRPRQTEGTSLLSGRRGHSYFGLTVVMRGEISHPSINGWRLAPHPWRPFRVQAVQLRPKRCLSASHLG
jgi:hypothetical protein